MNRYKIPTFTRPRLKSLCQGQFLQYKGTPSTGEVIIYEVFGFDETKQLWMIWCQKSHTQLELNTEYIYDHFDILNFTAP